MNRKLFAELTEGFGALKAERKGKIPLRRHTVKRKHAAFKSIKAGLQQAIAHQQGKSSGVKLYSVPHEQWLIERLKTPKLAAAYLESAIEDGDQAGIVLALRHVAKAQGLLLSVRPIARTSVRAR